MRCEINEFLEVSSKLCECSPHAIRSVSIGLLFVCVASERYDQYGFNQSSNCFDDVQSLAQSLLAKSERLLQTASMVRL